MPEWLDRHKLMNIRETALAELPLEVILTGSPTGKIVSGSGVWFSLVNRVVNSLV